MWIVNKFTWLACPGHFMWTCLHSATSELQIMALSQSIEAILRFDVAVSWKLQLTAWHRTYALLVFNVHLHSTCPMLCKLTHQGSSERLKIHRAEPSDCLQSSKQKLSFKKGRQKYAGKYSVDQCYLTTVGWASFWVTMQSCYQHPLHTQHADKNSACNTVLQKQRMQNSWHWPASLDQGNLVACTTLSKVLKPIPSLYSTIRFTPDVCQYKSRASRVNALVVLAQCLFLHTLAHQVTHVVGLKQGGVLSVSRTGSQCFVTIGSSLLVKTRVSQSRQHFIAP